MSATKRQIHSENYAKWIPLSTSIKLIFTRKRLFFLSSLLICLTIGLTWLANWILLDYIDTLTAKFMPASSESAGIWGWVRHMAMVVGSWLYLVISRVASFYLAFLVAYTLTTPGYAFLSVAAEKMHAGDYFDEDAAFTLVGIMRDVLEGLKIALFGIVVTVIALFLNFIPAIGQAAAFLLYCYYSALMFLDYPVSRRRWSLGRKLLWIRRHSSPSFRLGVLPALLSMIPIINIFAMALFFPVLTVHASLNFSAIEVARKRQGLENI